MDNYLPNELLKGISVHALIENSNKEFLLVRRSMTDDSDQGRWDLPGGGIERGESIEKGLYREIFEETGLHVTLVSFLGGCTVEDGTLSFIPLVKLKSGKVILSPEHDDFKWVEIDELISEKEASVHLWGLQLMIKENKRVINYSEIVASGYKLINQQNKYLMSVLKTVSEKTQITLGSSSSS